MIVRNRKRQSLAYGPEPVPGKENARAGQLYQVFKYFEGKGVKDFSWENNVEPAARHAWLD